MVAKKYNPTKDAARRKEVTDLIASLTKEKAELDAKLLSVDPTQTFEGEGVKLSFTPFRALDSAFITKKFPASKRPEFYKLGLDTEEFKKHFSAKELETYQKVTHRIKVVEL